MSNHPPTTLPVTVDKSHITVLGERLYTESIELIRELVNNAYDADATRVEVLIEPDRIVVEDNGSGMDLDGLKQYFNIGSPEKLLHDKSPRFHRARIGQFGIGKFATLSACDRFEVMTQKGRFAARVIFDKEDWQRSEDIWELPLEILEPDPKRGSGTRVILSRLRRTFDPEEVRRRVLESVPIQAKNFAVYVNGVRVVSTRLPGHRIPVLEGTPFGPVHGEIVIVPSSHASAEEMGIQVRVKGVVVKKEYFGIQMWGKEGVRVRGEVHADFLPITSDRSGFRIDTPEYEAFTKVMQQVMKEVEAELRSLSDRRETLRVRRALKEALERIQKALSRHPDFVDGGIVPRGELSDRIGEPAELLPENLELADVEEEEAEVEEPEPEGREPDAAEDVVKPAAEPPKPKVHRLTPRAVVRKISFGDLTVSCCLDHFGEDGPECFTEGQIIYINRDHPLYKRESKSRRSHTMHIARLLAQEISLMRDPANPREAYQRQSDLLRDAFLED
jgi:hypothetical protein